jgi:4'-phosphopantetheinyl transferase
VARGVRVGIDLELIRPYSEYLPIAERYFTSEEQELLRALPEERQAEAFFNFWTRKEAYLKAKGDGLSAPLEEASFLPVQVRRGSSLVIQDHQNGDSFWTAYTLSPAPHYIATLLVEERGWRIKCFRFD